LPQGHQIVVDGLPAIRLDEDGIGLIEPDIKLRKGIVVYMDIHRGKDGCGTAGGLRKVKSGIGLAGRIQCC
jgi:hypothetical protein